MAIDTLMIERVLDQLSTCTRWLIYMNLLASLLGPPIFPIDSHQQEKGGSTKDRYDGKGLQAMSYGHE